MAKDFSWAGAAEIARGVAAGETSALNVIDDAFARMKSREHWQSDVIAGWVLGSAVGLWSTTRATPISVQVLPRGLSVGYYKRF